MCLHLSATNEDSFRDLSFAKFGSVVAEAAKQPGTSWEQTYAGLSASKTARLANVSNVCHAHVKKITTDDVIHRIDLASSAIFGFAMPNPSTHYYPTGQKGHFDNHTITVFRKDE
jgi:hypothetical protein